MTFMKKLCRPLVMNLFVAIYQEVGIHNRNVCIFKKYLV